jgi:hypothetical protein
MNKAEMALHTQEILRVANEAAAKARAENKKLGIASPISINGKLYYELPDGTITDKKPA